MATGSGPPLASHELGEEDLAVVIEALVPVAERLEFFGLQIGMQMNEIAQIQKEFTDPCQCLLRILRTRLERSPALTWNDIDRALRARSVGKIQLANSIKKQYGHLFSRDPSFEASLGQEESGRKALAKTKQRAAKRGEPDSHPQYPTQVSALDQQESYKEVRQTETYRKPSKKVEIDDEHSCFVSKAADSNTRQKSSTKKYLEPEKEFEREMQHKVKAQSKWKAEHEKEISTSSESKMPLHDSQHQQKGSVTKFSQLRAQEMVQTESESESNSAEETNTDNFETAEEMHSSEQEQDSAEEVSETERYQKPSEQPKEEDSHRETPVRKTKGKRRKSSDLQKSKYESQSKAEGKAKRKKKAVDQSVSNEASQHETAVDVHGKCERVAQEHKQKMSEKHSKKGVQKAPRENESESSAMRREEERVSSLYHRGKSRKPKSAKDTHQQKQSQGKKLEYQTTAKKDVEKKGKGNVSVAGEQSSDEEVREKPAPKSLRQKEVQTKSESQDESSSASTSDDGSEPHLHESIRMKECHKVHPNTDGNANEKERAVRTKKEAKVTKRKGFHSSDTDMRKQSKEAKRSTKVNQKTKKTSKEKYLKADADTSSRKEIKEQAEKERVSKKKVLERGTPSSDSTQEYSEDEESDSDDSSEDEEDRDSEQISSNEEEETEPDDESSPDTSEVEVKRKPAVPYTKKEAGGRKGKRMKIAADVLDLPGDEDLSDPGGRDQEEHDIQPKKRSRRRHRESSMSPTTRGSSSPSTSQEENQRSKETPKPKGKGRKKKDVEKTKTKEGLSSSTETDNSSPECDMLRNITETERKGLRKVFKRSFGRLCFAIRNPVELATLLQMKGLLTYSVMNELLTSPESTQAKTITLVRALQKQVKSRPDRMFNIIQVFLYDEALQQTGREIWTETGKNVFTV